MEVLLFIIGAIFGSFYLVVGTRLPKGKDILLDRSKCDNCKQVLKWYDLIPIASYLIKRGKCSYCGSKIGIDCIFIEIVSGLLFLVGYLYLGYNIRYFIYLITISVGLIIFVSDLKYMIILDSPLVIGSIAILILRFFENGIKGVGYAILCGIFLFLLMFFIKKIGDYLFKRESLGGGDIKLSFLIGVTLGYLQIGIRLSLISLIFASFLALPYGLASIYLNKKNELPYGPFLIASCIIVFVFIEKFKNLLIFFLL